MRGVRLRNVQSEAAGAAGPAEPGAGGAARVRPAARWPFRLDRRGDPRPCRAPRRRLPDRRSFALAGRGRDDLGLPALAGGDRDDDAARRRGARAVLRADASGGRGRRRVGDRAQAPFADRDDARGRPDRGARAPARLGLRAAGSECGRAAGRPRADGGPADDQVRAGGQAVRAGHALRGRRDLRVRGRARESAAALVGCLRVGLAADRSVQPVRGADRGRARGKPALAP